MDYNFLKDFFDFCQRLKNLEEKMSFLTDLVTEVSAQQDAIEGAVKTIEATCNEVLNFLNAGDIASAVALVERVKANKEALVHATMLNTQIADMIPDGQPAQVVDEQPVA